MPPIPLPLSYSEAAQYLRAPASPIVALVSIHGKNEPTLEAPAIPRRLDLEFDDTDAPDSADPIAAMQAHVRRRALAELGRPQTPPALEHVEALITFARTLQHLEGTLLLHCSGGISRSPTAALICLASWTSPGQESACVQTIRDLRPAAQFHADLLRFADALLKRDGMLIHAIS